MIVADSAAIAEHARLFQRSFRTYPMIGYGGNITGLRNILYNESKLDWWTDYLVSEAVTRGYDGITVDFEPLTDVLNPSNNPTPHDALAFAALLERLGTKLHGATPAKTLSVDTMAVTGACWTSGGAKYPVRDLKPCPWIRSFWDLSALAAVQHLDRVIPMDT